MELEIEDIIMNHLLKIGELLKEEPSILELPFTEYLKKIHEVNSTEQ